MRVTQERRKVAVIGGGVTGLTAAYYLQRIAQQNNLPVDVVLIEASLRLGGKIQTLRKDGFIVERGPESFLDYKNSVRDLAQDLGIEQQLVPNNDGRTFVAVGSNLHPIPNLLAFGGALDVSSFITSGLFSLSGKLRAAGDLLLPKTKEDEDEPIGDFFRRRFGKEVVENLVEPLLAGTFAGDIDHLSIKSMFPQFYQLEKQHRSLILGLKKSGEALRNDHIETYQTFQNGLETLIETLASHLSPNSILKGVKVESIDRLNDGSVQIYTNNIAPIKCDAVIMTTPFNAAKEVLDHSGLLDELPKMQYATIATVTLAFKQGEAKKYKDAMNFFVSRNSDFAITTCTWCNHKWNDVAPAGYDLLRVYIGRVGDEAIVELSDSDIEKTVLQDLEKAIGLETAPVFTVVSRWKESMPQYTVGHDERMEVMKQQLHTDFPNVKLVGSSYDGISVPDCVTQGKSIADELLKEMFELQYA
ncbi:protoporphyrinogen oxidase [Ureibacillus chungkukjangi]|uniref:Coproporphyrinogen III oxidase n=2 Tax=Ureibacillus chungkukjangi TaxID=1202712 RepID=A0A318TVN2_9BACL|nr:protoporphyrinogen oxidase [Ureibacillus chungkukjangi]MCM3388625.1 protoporphyrinogen oxidase [Ureibacillus chungkukjangi]PYF05995.1 protoporphyrinogen oxidase [Ureibacillus chungkukjangi]